MAFPFRKTQLNPSRTGKTPLLRSLLQRVLLCGLVMAVVLFTVCTVLYFLDPLMSLPQWLRQARTGLLVWRLCLYATIGLLTRYVYLRVDSASRRQIKRMTILFTLLVVLSEISNLQAWRDAP